MFAPSSSYKISPDTVASQVGDKVILVNIKTDRIFSLNATGGRLWELLTSGKKIGEIRQIMFEEFDVPDEQLSGEIENLVQSFVEESLIMVENAG